MSECGKGTRFAFELIFEYLAQSFVRICSLIDLLLLISWSPVWSIPTNEPLAAVSDSLCYLRFASLNLARSFRTSTSIWPDALVVVVCTLSLVALSDILFDSRLYWTSLIIIGLEMASSVLAAERRRQRKLWNHNATFRISQFQRNPFQRSIRKSLLRPLLKQRQTDDAGVQTINDVEIGNGSAHDVRLDDRLISSFLDIVPEVRGANSEKRILHVHCLWSALPRPEGAPKVTVVFLHQFGSGSFTWQSVMAELCDLMPSADLIAFDRVAHGLTFPSDPLMPDERPLVDVTPVGDEEIVKFTDVVCSSEFDIEMTDSVIESRTQNDRSPIILVSCGGAGGNLAISFTTKSAHKNRVAGVIVLSPHSTRTDGIPSVLKSMASAQVGRALLVSMAKSEVSDVLLRRSWDSRDIPSSLTEAYKRAPEMPLWEDLMINLLRRSQSSASDTKSIRCPVLVVQGDQDHFLTDPDEYIKWANEFPNARAANIPGCGASPQEEKPHETVSLINDFIRSIW
jgi:pimeloyl-ACP methyl ester carboxylesterase